MLADELQGVLNLVAVCAAEKVVYVAGAADDQLAACVDDPPFVDRVRLAASRDKNEDDKQREFHNLKIEKAALTFVGATSIPRYKPMMPSITKPSNSIP